MTTSTRDDHELLAACADGDDDALAALYDRHGKVAYGLALRVVRDPSLAEDAVQEAFLAVWRQAATYDRTVAKPSTWILTLVHRRAVDLVRRQARVAATRERLAACEPLGVIVESLDQAAATREARRCVQSALRALPDKEREVLDLAYWGGMTQSQIAAALGVPSGTVKSRTFSALVHLQAALTSTSELVAA